MNNHNILVGSFFIFPFHFLIIKNHFICIFLFKLCIVNRKAKEIILIFSIEISEKEYDFIIIK